MPNTSLFGIMTQTLNDNELPLSHHLPLDHLPLDYLPLQLSMSNTSQFFGRHRMGDTGLLELVSVG